MLLRYCTNSYYLLKFFEQLCDPHQDGFKLVLTIQKKLPNCITGTTVRYNRFLKIYTCSQNASLFVITIENFVTTILYLILTVYNLRVCCNV